MKAKYPSLVDQIDERIPRWPAYTRQTRFIFCRSRSWFLPSHIRTIFCFNNFHKFEINPIYRNSAPSPLSYLLLLVRLSFPQNIVDYQVVDRGFQVGSVVLWERRGFRSIISR